MLEDPLEHRKTAARMANLAREKGADWFEDFYQWTRGDESKVPWADMGPHPLLAEWLEGKELGSVAVVGAGLGDDAEAVSRSARGVWAFDVSPTAMAWAQQRFPQSVVEYCVADLFDLTKARLAKFDAVIEIYTLQALPPERRPAAFAALASLLAPGGELVVITRWRTPETELGPVPWPLLKSELDAFDAMGLSRIEETQADEGLAIRMVWAQRQAT